ncbi:MAG: hypothetical protein VW625_10465, partial [Perlucidibaca sp.]
RLGADQALGDRPGDDRHHGMAVFEGGGGLAARAGSAICHAQSHSDLRGGPGLDLGWEAGTGARFGCTGGAALIPGLPAARWLLEERSLYRWPAAGWNHELRSGLQLSLPGRDAQALRVELRQEWRDKSLTSFSLSWFRYF